MRELEAKHARLTSELDEKQREQARAEDIVRDRKQARKTALEIEKISTACDGAKEALGQSERKVRELEEKYRDLQAKVEELSGEKDRTAEGLSDASKAWEQISRNVALFRLARQSLEDCRKAIPGRELDGESAPALLEECRLEWGRALESKTRIERELESLNTRLEAYEETLRALESASGKKVSRENAFEAAKELEDDIRKTELLVREASNLPEQVARATGRAERQQAIRKKVSHFETMGEEIGTVRQICGRFSRPFRKSLR